MSATVEQILDSSRASKRLTKMAKWQALTDVIHRHIDEAYMLGEETATLHLSALLEERMQALRHCQGLLDERTDELERWQRWYTKFYEANK